MGKYRSLARNTAILSVGTLLSKLVAFFMVRFYTGVLSPAEYGIGDLLITTVSLLMPFVSLGISEGVFRFLPEYPGAKKSVFSIGIYTVAAGSLLLAACCHCVCEQYVRAEGNTLLYAKQGLMNTLLVVSLNILLLTVFRLGVTGYALSVGTADLLCTLYLVLRRRLWRFLTRRPDRRLLRKMLRYSIPLIPTTVF